MLFRSVSNYAESVVKKADYTTPKDVKDMNNWVEKLKHLVVGERIKPVGAELLFFARAMSFVYRHVCSPFRGVFAAKRGSLLLFLS